MSVDAHGHPTDPEVLEAHRELCAALTEWREAEGYVPPALSDAQIRRVAALLWSGR